MRKKQNVYKKVVDVTSGYLGPAADRFISRQIETHLNKKPNELTREDIYKLTDCMKVAIALLTGDGKVVDSYTQRLLEISKK